MILGDLNVWRESESWVGACGCSRELGQCMLLTRNNVRWWTVSVPTKYVPAKVNNNLRYACLTTMDKSGHLVFSKSNHDGRD